MKRLIAVFVVVLLVGSIVGPTIASAGNGPAGPAPESGDGISNGSGLDSPNGPNGHGSDSGQGHDGPAPESGDGISNGSGW